MVAAVETLETPLMAMEQSELSGPVLLAVSLQLTQVTFKE
jgi:hypothetical protein